nr:vegetative incompatibility protein het-e-1 [Quercus suber]
MLVSLAWGKVWLWSVMIGKVMQKMKCSNRVTAVSFAPDGMSLMTDIGRFEVTQYFSGTSTQKMQHSYGLLLNGEWIQYQGRDLLWLPHEYRGLCSRFCGDTIVIGQFSGAVSFLRHNLS